MLGQGNTNLLLSGCKGRGGKYWPDVVAAQRGPCKNNQGPIFPSTAQASLVSK